MRFNSLFKRAISGLGFGAAEPVRRKSLPAVHVVDIDPGSYTDFVVRGYARRITARMAADFYRTSSAVAVAVDTIADEVEQIRPVLRLENGKFEDSHEILDLLRAPNPDDTYQCFVGEMCRNWLLSHDALVAAVGNLRSAPASIYAVSPQLVHATPDVMRGYARQFQIVEGPVRGSYNRDQRGRERARYVDGPLKELYHLRGYSSRPNQIFSDSPLEAAALEARQQLLGRHHNLRLLENGARLSLVAVFKDTIDDTEHQRRKQAIQEQLTGADNAGTVAVISSEDLDLRELGINNKDMDFAKLDDAAKLAIFNRYKTPLPLVLPDVSTYNNMQNAVYHLYDFCVIPAFERVMSGLSRFLLPRFGLDPVRTTLTYDPERISALMTRRLEELTKRAGLNIETTNELRELLPNRDPVDGGDTVLRPVNLVPLDTVPETDESAEDAVNRILSEGGEDDEDADG